LPFVTVKNVRVWGRAGMFRRWLMNMIMHRKINVLFLAIANTVGIGKLIGSCTTNETR